MVSRIAANDRVKVEVANGVADVRLSRPEKMNAIDPRMFEALIEVGESLKSQANVRAVVLSGDGRAFCAGIDMRRFSDGTGSGPKLPPRHLAPRTHGIANEPQRAVLVWRELPVPAIAAVHGVAFGAGFQLSLGADIRYLDPEARLSVMEVEWGLVPDMAGTALMRQLARDDIIRELSYTGRIFSAEEAYAYGFATHLCREPRNAALSLATVIAQKSPDAIRASKRLLNGPVYTDMAERLLSESKERDALVQGVNHQEAVAARLARRNPAFTDPARKVTDMT
jgi:enoyl-CoA hydratase/carnithine racemase